MYFESDIAGILNGMDCLSRHNTKFIGCVLIEILVLGEMVYLLYVGRLFNYISETGGILR